MNNKLFQKIVLLITVTMSLATLTLEARSDRYYYDNRGRDRFDRHYNRRRYPDNYTRKDVNKYVRHDHRVKVEVKRPHRDLYTALDVINTVANVVDAFTPSSPTIVQTNTVAPSPATIVPTFPAVAPVVQPTYQQPVIQQQTVVQPGYQQPTIVENSTYVPTQPVYTQPVQPMVTPQPVVVQPPVQNNTTIVVPPANPSPYRRPFLPPRYYNRPIYTPHGWR